MVLIVSTLLSTYVLLFALQGHFCIDLTYSTEEGKSPNTFLGNVATDSNVLGSVQSKDHKLITFSLLQEGIAGNTQLFRVSKNTGKLYTAHEICVGLCDRHVYEKVQKLTKEKTLKMNVPQWETLFSPMCDYIL